MRLTCGALFHLPRAHGNTTASRLGATAWLHASRFYHHYAAIHGGGRAGWPSGAWLRTNSWTSQRARAKLRQVASPGGRLATILRGAPTAR